MKLLLGSFNIGKIIKLYIFKKNPDSISGSNRVANNIEGGYLNVFTFIFFNIQNLAKSSYGQSPLLTILIGKIVKI
jgi:hypothetical protein